MMLLSFTVRNHKSIRDEVTIDLTHRSLRTLRPRDGEWGTAAYPIAGIFGGNATGKSAVLDALLYTFTAINLSATAWQATKSMHRAPFLLDGTERTSSSMYELDFVHEGRRHLYGFEVDHEGIKCEWLRDVPNSRWRTLLDRDREAGTLTFHASLRGKIEITDRELALSRALLLRDSPLHPIAQDLISSFDCVLVKDSHREARLSNIADSLAEGTITFPDLEALLEVADIGVIKVGLEETKVPENLLRAINRFRRELSQGNDDLGDPPTEKPTDDDETNNLNNEQLVQVVRHMVFTHRGAGDACPKFSILDESDGTIAWLAIAVPALEKLRQGGLILIDEIDASLHPHLLEVLLGTFADRLVNVRNAQVIFTSHESYILSPLSDVQLDPEQVWLTEKTSEGVTQLTCLADFPRHPDANVARRYLTGRYGGTPRLLPSRLAALVTSQDH